MSYLSIGEFQQLNKGWPQKIEFFEQTENLEQIRTTFRRIL